MKKIHARPRLYIDEDVHRELKAAAALEGKAVNRFADEILILGLEARRERVTNGQVVNQEAAIAS